MASTHRWGGIPAPGEDVKTHLPQHGTAGCVASREGPLPAAGTPNHRVAARAPAPPHLTCRGPCPPPRSWSTTAAASGRTTPTCARRAPERWTATRAGQRCAGALRGYAGCRTWCNQRTWCNHGRGRLPEEPRQGGGQRAPAHARGPRKCPSEQHPSCTLPPHLCPSHCSSCPPPPPPHTHTHTPHTHTPPPTPTPPPPAPLQAAPGQDSQPGGHAARILLRTVRRCRCQPVCCSPVSLRRLIG